MGVGVIAFKFFFFFFCLGGQKKRGQKDADFLGKKQAIEETKAVFAPLREKLLTAAENLEQLLVSLPPSFFFFPFPFSQRECGAEWMGWADMNRIEWVY